ATEGAYKTNNENVWVGPNDFAVHDAFLAKFIQGNFETISEPQHTTPCLGDTTQLILGITTNPLTDFSFQWYKDNEILAGKTDSILIVPNSSVSDNGYYYCTFMDNGYTWKSDSANVFTQSEPAFTKVGNDTCHLCEWPGEIQNRYRVPFEEFWADIDNDHDLDALIIGREKNTWMNDLGSFTQLTQNLNQFSELSAAIADYDGDNDLDLVINGDTAGWNTATTILYRNDNGVFNRTNDVFYGMFDGMIKWADLDNDGDQDLVIAGIKFNGGYNVYFYENRKDSFLLKTALYPGNDYGFIEFGDYDKDGDLDFLIGGREGSKIYNNSGGNFTNINAGLQGLTYCSGKWGDYDSDGDLDVILNGTMSINGDGDSTILYRNNYGTFERITHQIPNTRNKIHFVDYDNDGDMDVIGGNRLSQNNENTFIERPSNTPEIHTGILNSHVEPGDYDNDGDIDLLGWNEVYRNDACNIYNTPNLPPSAPVSISNIIHYDTVHFSWGAATDDKTPQIGLTYNLKVGTTPGGNQIMSSLSNASGWRKMVGMGNMQQNTSWWLKLPEGTYYWSVQAIDNSFAGGPFSTEEAFTIIKHPQITTQPISSVICPDDSVVMRIETSSYFPLTYLWYKNNTIISGANDSIFIKLAADSSDIAQYYCKVSNSSYDTYSDTISVDVRYRPYFILDTILTQGKTQFADLDSDGDLDLILNRSWVYNQWGSGSYDPKTQIYFNSNGTYSLSGSFNFNTDLGSSLISDLNGDGLPDILFYNSDSVRLFINNSGVFTQFQTTISNTNNAKVMSGDMDNDGDFDLVIINRGMFNAGASVKILLNEDLNFLEITLNVRHALYGDGLLLDYDSDGDLDIFYTGFHYYWLDPTLPAGNFATILVNDKLQFTTVDQGFYALEGSSFASDINYDGKTDMLVSGTHSPGWPHSLKAFICDSTSPSGFVQQDIGLPNSKRIISVGDIDNNGFIDAITEDHIYFNNNGYFSDSTLVVAGRPGDFDNDGNLDLLAGSEIYQSQSCADQVNTPPTSPSGLSVSIVDSITHFSWSNATDSQTPQLGLSYNLRLGTSPGGSDVMSAMSNPNGYRQVVEFGNVQQNTSWWIKNLAPGTYYWSVQAIDNSFTGGLFAPEQSFLVYSDDNISGTFRYNNTQNTVLDSVETTAHFSGIAIDSCLSISSGEYQLRSVYPGSYLLTFNSLKTLSGVNGTDALKIQRHFAGLESITEPVRLQAADVNNSGGINGTDAVQVKRRFAGMDASFERGDWTFAKPVVGGDTII
ncbi:MAG: FG-GAP-like repeat-containing protein, partial [Bacteroidales bacterium]